MNERLKKLKNEFILSADPQAAVRFANAVIQEQTLEDKPVEGAVPIKTPPRQGAQVTIPTIGTVLELAEDWSFDLFSEYRNSNFWDKVITDQSPEPRYYGGPGQALNYRRITLPRGTTLKVSRIYIRQGGSNYDSITFSIVKHATNKKIKGRFWAKLHDVNRMLVNWQTDTVKGHDDEM